MRRTQSQVGLMLARLITLPHLSCSEDASSLRTNIQTGTASSTDALGLVSPLERVDHLCDSVVHCLGQPK